MAIGSVLGYMTNVLFQEKIYECANYFGLAFSGTDLMLSSFRKKFPTRGPEARLYSTCVAGVMFPISMFIYAGCSATNVPWVGMCIAIVVRKSLQ